MMMTILVNLDPLGSIRQQPGMVGGLAQSKIKQLTDPCKLLMAMALLILRLRMTGPAVFAQAGDALLSGDTVPLHQLHKWHHCLR